MMMWICFIGMTILPMVGCQKPQATKANTSLHLASLTGELEIVKEYVRDNANVNELDQFEKSPLHYAAQGGQTEIMEFLLANGADLELKGLNGWTPIFSAVRGAQPAQAVEVLVEHGAITSQRDVQGETPLSTAIRLDEMEAAEIIRKSMKEDS